MDNVLDFGTVQQQNVNRVADGSEQSMRMLRDGCQVTADFLFASLLEGTLYVANYGTGTTDITGVTAVTAAQPQINLDVPKGVAVIPVWLHLNVTAMTGTANHFYVNTSQQNVGAGTSTAVSTFNARGDKATSSQCTARQAYSGSGTAPSGGYEIMHWTQIAANGAGSANVYDFLYQFPPVACLVGPAAIAGYMTSTTTAAHFQATLAWIELPSSAIQ